MTYEYYNQHQDEACALIADLISPAPTEFIAEQVAYIFGDKAGTFDEKYGDDRHNEVDVRALQLTLTQELSGYERKVLAQ